MKKLILSLVALMGFSMMVAGQEVASKTVKKTESTTTVKTEAKAADDKTKTTVVLKKDGTPDKRYKKTTKVVTKKDGTPDMRYKENQK